MIGPLSRNSSILVFSFIPSIIQIRIILCGSKRIFAAIIRPTIKMLGTTRYNKDIWRRGYDLLCGNVEKNLNIGSCSRCIDTDYSVTTVSFGKSEISTTELAAHGYKKSS